MAKSVPFSNHSNTSIQKWNTSIQKWGPLIKGKAWDNNPAEKLQIEFCKTLNWKLTATQDFPLFKNEKERAKFWFFLLSTETHHLSLTSNTIHQLEPKTKKHTKHLSKQTQKHTQKHTQERKQPQI